MARETADLVPRTSAEEVLRAGRRRARRRTLSAAAAAVALAVTAVPVAVWSTGGGERGDPTVGVSPPATSPSAPFVRPTGDPSQAGCPADPKTAKAIGDTIATRVTDSSGRQVLVRFLQNDRDPGLAGFAVGLLDPATRQLDRLGCTFGFPLPPAAASYPGTSAEFDGPDFSGPDKTTTIVGSFVGPAHRITASYGGRPLTVAFTRWSAHPEVVVYWVTGVPAGAESNPRDSDHPLVTVYDAAGNVVSTPAR
jgi:hypothetical protein